MGLTYERIGWAEVKVVLTNYKRIGGWTVTLRWAHLF
jgi:hypothetical protein